MTNPFEIHTSCKELSPITPVMPYRLSDVFTYLSNRKSDAESAKSKITAVDEVESGLHTQTVEEIKTCQTALDRLATLQDRGTTILFLDVTRDVAAQIDEKYPAPQF